MNNINYKLLSLTKIRRLNHVVSRACISTLLRKAPDGTCGPEGEQKVRTTLLTAPPPIALRQCRMLQHDTVNPKVTPWEVPGKGKLVYFGTMAARIKVLKLFSFSTSMLGCAIVPKIIGELEGAHIMGQIAAGVGSGFFICITPFLVHMIAKRYVNWMYYDKTTNTFTATTFNFIGRNKDHVFTPDDVDPYSHGLLSSIKVRNVPLALDPNLFLDSSMYSKLMGFDKAEWTLPDQFYEDEAKREAAKDKNKSL